MDKKKDWFFNVYAPNTYKEAICAHVIYIHMYMLKLLIDTIIYATHLI